MPETESPKAPESNPPVKLRPPVNQRARESERVAAGGARATPVAAPPGKYLTEASSDLSREQPESGSDLRRGAIHGGSDLCRGATRGESDLRRGATRGGSDLRRERPGREQRLTFKKRVPGQALFFNPSPPRQRLSAQHEFERLGDEVDFAG